MEFHPRPITLSSKTEEPSSFDDCEQVAIYNEDDLSHFLYFGHDDNVKVVNQVNILSFDNSSVGSHTPESEASHGASLDDFDLLEDHMSLSESSTTHAASTKQHHEEPESAFPTFLGRQDEEPAEPEATCSKPFCQRSTDSAADAAAANESLEVDTSEEQGVDAIEGPMMSWWPAPAGQINYPWVEKRRARPHLVKANQGVDRIDGPMMSWWPAPVEMLDHEWVERFFE